VRRSNVVLTAGTAPFGGNVLNITRVAPAAFWRSVFCVSARLRPLRCPHPAKFDVLAHDPYSVARPTQRALNGDDVSIPDMGKLIRPLRAAERTHRIRPAGRKAVWVTEFGWDSRPPDPNGVPIQQHARWLEQALYVLWRQGVAMATWFKIVDEPSGGDFGATYQSGLYEVGGTAKPALTAFAFPFVTERVSRSRVRVWGKAPASGSVSIQRQAGAAWRTLRTLHVSGSRVFLTTLALRGSAVLRAVSGGNASLTWGQR